MKYRKLGDSEFDISILTAGLFQLDFVTDTIPQDDFDKQLGAVRYAIGSGVNALDLGFPFYLDDPWPYTEKVKAFLAEDGVREQLKLFINLPVTGNPSLRDFDDRLQLLHEWFGIDKFDYCLVEDIERFGWVRFERLGVLDWAKRQIAEGRIEKLGFDFRDDCFFLKTIFETYDWAVAQFHYSFMDSTLHPGFSGIEYVTEANAGLIVTEPFKTRRLLKNIPEAAQALWDSAKVQHSVEEWALLWIWNHPEISSVVTSFADTEEAKRFLGYADAQAPIDMFAEITINKVIDVYKKKRVFGCTECRCCMPCPIDMDSPGIAALFNDYLMYEEETIPKFLYKVRKFDEQKCKNCGLCSKHCPRRYKIMDAVQKSQELFGNVE
jgi:predicted aldo/keto reductase-like oxidoreductase